MIKSSKLIEKQHSTEINFIFKIFITLKTSGSKVCNPRSQGNKISRELETKWVNSWSTAVS